MTELKKPPWPLEGHVSFFLSLSSLHLSCFIKLNRQSAIAAMNATPPALRMPLLLANLGYL